MGNCSFKQDGIDHTDDAGKCEQIIQFSEAVDTIETTKKKIKVSKTDNWVSITKARETILSI